MKTKIFTLLFAVVASTITLFAQSGKCGANLTWTLVNGTLTISGTGEMYDYALDSPQWESYGSSINTVIIEEGVTSVGAWAFNYYPSIQNVTISNTVKRIGKCAFASTSISSIEIPNSVTTIGNSSFQLCSKLTSVVIGASVRSISNYAFNYCRSISSITCYAVIPPVCDAWCFDGVYKDIPLYVPAGSVDSYSEAAEWKDFYNIQAINTEAIDEVITNQEKATKLIYNNQVFIRCTDKTYTITGQEVK